MLGIIVYSIGSWEGFHRRPMLQALARNLRGKGFLLVVEPPVSLLDARHMRDWRPAARAVVRGTEQVADNIWLARPKVSREGRGEFAAYAQAIRASLRQITPRADRVVAWIYRPDQAWLLGAADENAVVYECYDEYRVTFAGEPIAGVREEESRLLAAAQVVLTTSRPLHDSRAAEHSRVYLTPNGMDYEVFARVSGSALEVAADMRGLPRPVVGYVGNFANWLDVDLIASVARTVSEGTFVFVGPVTAPDRCRAAERQPERALHGIGALPV